MGRKRRQGSKPMLRRTSDKISDGEQSWNVSTTQESITEQIFTSFAITDIRSLSEQNCDYYDLIPIKQDLDGDVSSSAYPDKQDDFLVNHTEPPFTSEWNSDNSVNVSQPFAILHYCTESVSLNEAPSIMNNNYCSENLGTSVAVDHENIANNSTDAIVNEEINSVVLHDTDHSLQSNNIVEQQKHVDTNDELMLFEKRLTNQLRQMPLRNALILQGEIQDIITLERLKCIEKQ